MGRRQRTAVGPRAYHERKPSSRSIRLGGRFINLNRLASDHDLDRGYLSRIFAGERTPSVEYALRIAAALGMGLEELLDAIDDRKKYILIRARRRLHSA